MSPDAETNVGTIVYFAYMVVLPVAVKAGDRTLQPSSIASLLPCTLWAWYVMSGVMLLLALDRHFLTKRTCRRHGIDLQEIAARHSLGAGWWYLPVSGTI